MKNLIEKLYKKVIYYSEDYLITGKRLDVEVSNLLKPYHGKLTQDEVEELQNIIYSACYESQFAGFKLGAKAIVSMLTDILSL